MNRIFATFAFCLFLLSPICAWCEDIVSTWRQSNGTTMAMAMRDADHVRVDSEKDAYILAIGKKVYMVSKRDGQWTVMDMEELAGMMNRFGIKAGTPGSNKASYRSSFERTGRTEIVAGFRGTVYAVETKDESGQVVDRSEIVFSKHEDVARVSQAWMRVASRMGDMLGPQTSREIETATKQAEMSGYGGILRADEMTLVGIQKRPLSASYFDLPEGAEIVGMGTLSGQGKQPGNADDTNFAEELGREAGEAAQEEAQQNTIDEVRKGVDGVFKKIFN